jgi:RNA 2',3'-cyclic 3'-phosphodiesterase
VREALGRQVERLTRIARGVAWVATDNVHLTLKFLGQVDVARLGEVRDALDRAVSAARPFDLSVHGLGGFPTAARPRVIWAGVGDGVAPLADLAARVDAALERVGFEREARPFSPHLTLGRVREPRRDPRLEAAIVEGGGERFGTLHVTRVSLMRSDLSPRGARYAVLASHELG